MPVGKNEIMEFGLKSKIRIKCDARKTIAQLNQQQRLIKIIKENLKNRSSGK